MTFPVNTDELLVAYLDNELSAEQYRELEERLSEDCRLAERLALLQRSSLPFKAAFEPLLEAAPQAHLQTHLTSVRPAFSRRGLIAAAVSFLALGAIGDRAFIHFTQPEDNWRERVAQYMALYTPETLSDTPTPQALESQLRIASQRLGLTLTAARLSLPQAALKNARVLAYEEQHIAQITWLDPKTGPLALCITQGSGTTSERENERRLGMNIVYWADKNHQFMVIGHSSSTQMNEIAGRLQKEVRA